MFSVSLWRSAGVRLAIVYAALFAVSALALVMFLWFATAGVLDRQSEAAIRTDAQGLLEQFEAGGLTALQSTIEDRLVQNVDDDDAIYLLIEPITTRSPAIWRIGRPPSPRRTGCMN